MSKQIQVQTRKHPKPVPAPDAPTVSQKLARLWFDAS